MQISSSTETLRKQNRLLVLSSLRALGPASHTEIATWSGLSSATISTITTELETENILEKLPQENPSGRGRPRVLLRQNPECAYAAIIRITSDELEFSLIDYLGTLQDRFSGKRDRNNEDTDTFCTKINTGLKKLASRSKLAHDKIRRISITCKGLVMRDKPILLWSAILGDSRIDFEKLLKRDWNAKISLNNESGFAAQAIAEETRPRGAFSLLPTISVLSLGHSIGFGMTSQSHQRDEVVTRHFQFGHMLHSKDGPLCRCGQHGCIESYAGFYGILRRAFEVPEDTIPAKFIPLEEMDKIADRARKGDLVAEYAFRKAGEVLGIGLSRMHNFYPPNPIAITGPGIRYLDLMLPALRENIGCNLLFRFEDMPEISIHPDEGELVFRGNVQATQFDLDRLVVDLF